MFLEATAGFEPANKGFAGPCLTTWPRRQGGRIVTPNPHEGNGTSRDGYGGGRARRSEPVERGCGLNHRGGARKNRPDGAGRMVVAGAGDGI